MPTLRARGPAHSLLARGLRRASRLLSRRWLDLRSPADTAPENLARFEVRRHHRIGAGSAGALLPAQPCGGRSVPQGRLCERVHLLLASRLPLATAWPWQETPTPDRARVMARDDSRSGALAVHPRLHLDRRVRLYQPDGHPSSPALRIPQLRLLEPVTGHR